MSELDPIVSSNASFPSAAHKKTMTMTKTTPMTKAMTMIQLVSCRSFVSSPNAAPSDENSRNWRPSRQLKNEIFVYVKMSKVITFFM